MEVIYNFTIYNLQFGLRGGGDPPPTPPKGGEWLRGGCVAGGGVSEVGSGVSEVPLYEVALPR